MNETYVYLAIVGFMGWGVFQLLLMIRDMVPVFVG